jgi:hypothetical protein
MKKTIKNTITTAIAGSYFVPKEVQCVKVLDLFGRLLLGLNPHGANNYSLNRIGMSGVLKLIYSGIRSQLRKIYASAMDTSSGVTNIIIRKKTLIGMFKIGMGYTRGLETLVALTGVGFQLENIISTMASRKKNLMNNSKKCYTKVNSWFVTYTKFCFVVTISKCICWKFCKNSDYTRGIARVVYDWCIYHYIN